MSQYRQETPVMKQCFANWDVIDRKRVINSEDERRGTFYTRLVQFRTILRSFALGYEGPETYMRKRFEFNTYQ